MLVLSLVLAALATYVVATPLAYTSPMEKSNLLARALSSSCSATGTASCHNSSAVSNLCCFEYPGGLLMQTQFWDTNPSTGPTNSWTIHGLWPDHCDQTFEENCDPSRAYKGIANLLADRGASDTLDFMNTYWVDINGQNEQFWEHEWSTHGTCMSTLRTSCLPRGSARGAEAVAFFNTVVQLFQSLPTYDWLANAGIIPSSSKTHTLSSLKSALKAGAGVTPALSCKSGVLNAISWYFNLRGSVIDGNFVPINAPTSGSCPSSGIKYPAKTEAAVTTTTTKTTTSLGQFIKMHQQATTTQAYKLILVPSFSQLITWQTSAGSLPTRATFHAIQSGTIIGGLLTLGTWSTQTLATMTLKETTSSFTMASSRGPCGVSADVFACGSGVTGSNFSAVTSGDNLLVTYEGSTAFSSIGIPSGTTVYTVFTDSSHAQAYTLSIIPA